MPAGNEIRNRTFRWRSIRVMEHGANNLAIIEEIAPYLGDKRLEFTKVEHVGPQDVWLEYRPAFCDGDRKIILDVIKNKWPKAKVGFYGEESVTILRNVVCLDEFIQGS